MRRSFKWLDVDWVMLGSAMVLSAIGILIIRSAAGSGGASVFAERQAYWLGIALAAYLVGYFVDRRHLRRSAYVLYALVLLALVALMLVGRLQGGVHRWIHVGGMTFQPSELAKLTLILCLARYFHKIKAKPPLGITEILIPFLLVAGYAIPVALQPDLGTAMFLVLLSVPLFLMMGLERPTVISLTIIAAMVAPIMFFSLKDYQRERILNFLSPGRDPLGTGYHVVQSKIAIGSGGLFGKGYLQGTQSQLQFIPEQHTDFIFSVLAEEFGFAGVLVVIGLLLFISLWMLSYLEVAKTKFAVLTVVGITCGFALQSVINIAMVAGILPVVGLPLPLISYGGSSLVTTFLGLGIVAGYRRRRT
ncbi:MAG: rod shape-determining protein RodA [bacterium]|nr:MAG: rod shape-determining protein RodA [bacterium]